MTQEQIKEQSNIAYQETSLLCDISFHEGFEAGAKWMQDQDNTPKLVDFINRISGEMLRNDFVLSEKWYEQAIDLLNKTKQY